MDLYQGLPVEQERAFVASCGVLLYPQPVQLHFNLNNTGDIYILQIFIPKKDPPLEPKVTIGFQSLVEWQLEEENVNLFY